MSKDTKIILGVILFLAIVLVAVGYAAITTIPLKIEGTATAEASDANFSVKFSGNPTTGGVGTVEANITDNTHATMNVSKLTAKGQTATATYTIQNTSADLSAALTATTSSGKEDYFKVTYAFEGGATTKTIEKGATTTITVTVELLKTPVDETAQELTSTIGVTINADAVQP